jgi:hypothetical protein
VQADADGTFSIKVPYSNSYYSGRIKTSDYYKVAFKRDGDLIKARLDITDEDVLNGEAIELVR